MEKTSVRSIIKQYNRKEKKIPDLTKVLENKTEGEETVERWQGTPPRTNEEVNVDTYCRPQAATGSRPFFCKLFALGFGDRGPPMTVPVSGKMPENRVTATLGRSRKEKKKTSFSSGLNFAIFVCLTIAIKRRKQLPRRNTLKVATDQQYKK